MYNHHVNIAGWPLAVLAITSCLLYSIQPILGCSIPKCLPNENVCTCSNGRPKPIPGSFCGGLIHYCSDGGKCKPEENGCSAEQRNKDEETSTCMCSDYMYGSWGNCSKVYGDGPICYVAEPSNCIDKKFSSKTGRYYSWNACREPENPFNNENKNPLKQVCKKSTSIKPRQVKTPEEVQVISDQCQTKYRQECINVVGFACKTIPYQVCKGKTEIRTTYKYKTVYEQVEEIKCEPTTSDNK